MTAVWLQALSETPHAQQLAPPRFGDDDALAGLEWTFVRIRYRSEAARLEQFRRTYWSDPWAIDAPSIVGTGRQVFHEHMPGKKGMVYLGIQLHDLERALALTVLL